MAGGKDNLIPLKSRTAEEQRALQVNGGKKSGIARRKKRNMREALEYIMATPASKADADKIKSIFPELQDEEIDGYMEVAALLRAHSRKSYQAAIKVAELTGGAPEQKISVSGSPSVVYITPAQAKATDKHIDAVINDNGGN